MWKIKIFSSIFIFLLNSICLLFVLNSASEANSCLIGVIDEEKVLRDVYAIKNKGSFSSFDTQIENKAEDRLFLEKQEELFSQRIGLIKRKVSYYAFRIKKCYLLMLIREVIVYHPQIDLTDEVIRFLKEN
ncbi:hypothetical protein QI155_10885 [Thermodesulfovibrio sp. 1176]|uniref:hypothetical protein n=1 Tax=Thermodesulfovibrio sp. 1176 TaxID=3043424 RepID=UPI00248260A0|nr:hypothetical protein [Thermodesulfovibrio sp. 1176]MDI1473037.1 hypothetical protein [Thermodesulfovibrio sp. 1176]